MTRPRKPRDHIQRLRDLEDAIGRLLRRRPSVEDHASGTPTLTYNGEIVVTPTAIYWRSNGVTHHANLD